MGTMAPDYPRMDPEHRPASKWFRNHPRLRMEEQRAAPERQPINREGREDEPPPELPPAA